MSLISPFKMFLSPRSAHQKVGLSMLIDPLPEKNTKSGNSSTILRHRTFRQTTHFVCFLLRQGKWPELIYFARTKQSLVRFVLSLSCKQFHWKDLKSGFSFWLLLPTVKRQHKQSCCQSSIQQTKKLVCLFLRM